MTALADRKKYERKYATENRISVRARLVASVTRGTPWFKPDPH
jgi:hypothetical protein